LFIKMSSILIIWPVPKLRRRFWLFWPLPPLYVDILNYQYLPNDSQSRIHWVQWLYLGAFKWWSTCFSTTAMVQKLSIIFDYTYVQNYEILFGSFLHWLSAYLLMAQSYFEYYLNNIEKSCEIAAFKAY